MDLAFFLIALKRVLLVVSAKVKDKLATVYLYTFDFFLMLINLMTPDHLVGHVISEGNPGYNGLWPKFIPPGGGDSRSPCPALNALANHGIVNRNGKDIKFTELEHAIRKTYNLSAPFSQSLSHLASGGLNRNWSRDTLNLSDLSAHNLIEHDASWCREDAYTDPHQISITVDKIEELLTSGTGPHGNLTRADMSRELGKIRTRARETNPQFSLSNQMRYIGAINSGFILKTFGGIVSDLRTLLAEERIPDGWEPHVRHRMGLTMAEANVTIFSVELGVKEEVDGSMNTPHLPGNSEELLPLIAI